MEQNKTNSLLFCIVYYLLWYTVLNEYICGQCRSKGGEVEVYTLGADGGSVSTHFAVP